MPSLFDSKATLNITITIQEEHFHHRPYASLQQPNDVKPKDVIQLHIITLILQNIKLPYHLKFLFQQWGDTTSKCDIYNYKTSHKCHLQLVATTWLCSSKDHIVNNTSC